MTPGGLLYSRERIAAEAMDWGPDGELILDGLACVVCAGTAGDMVACGCGPRGQVFRHPACRLGDDR